MGVELNTINARMTQVPGTILKILNLPVPGNIPEPIKEVSGDGVERIVLIILENFGLFEIVVYKPEFIINNLESIVLLDTENPYTVSVLYQIVYGDLGNSGFNLLEYLREKNKSSVVIGKGEDIKGLGTNFEKIESSGDMTTWIQGSKILNRRDLIWLNFQDFEILYQRSLLFKREPPENLIKRLIHRTDKWLLGMFKQARERSMFIIIGNHGKKEINMNLSGKYAEWRKASLPVGIICRK
ncbi:MAG: hypothetical protein ACTSPY_08170 [Candidatus Helarchaeota archaeon]